MRKCISSSGKVWKLWVRDPFCNMHAVIYPIQHYHTLHWNSFCTNICSKSKTYPLSGIIAVFSMPTLQSDLILFFQSSFLRKEAHTFSSYVCVSLLTSADCWAHELISTKFYGKVESYFSPTNMEEYKRVAVNAST